MEPGRLELYPYHIFIESSEEKEAVRALVFVEEQDVAVCHTDAGVKGQP